MSSANRLVLGPQTIATRIHGFASARFRSWATLISADVRFSSLTAIQFQAEPRTAIHARVVPKRTRLLWLGVPIGFGDRVKRRPAKIQRPRAPQLGRRWAETSDDVIRKITYESRGSLSRSIFAVRRASLINDWIFQDSVSDLSSNRVRANPPCG